MPKSEDLVVIGIIKEELEKAISEVQQFEENKLTKEQLVRGLEKLSESLKGNANALEKSPREQSAE